MSARKNKKKFPKGSAPLPETNGGAIQGPAPAILPFAAAAFSGAFLLFLIQPLISKYLLPWFGGAGSVWTTSVLFFQVMLLLGYVYAHVLARFLSHQWQARIYIAVLIGAAMVLAIHAIDAAPGLPLNRWRDFDTGEPIRHLLRILLATIGLPFVVLAATGPLVQAWFARGCPGRTPYPLYALSNLGSLLALIAYPVIVERFFPLTIQAWCWSAGFVVFAVTASLSARAVVRAGKFAPCVNGPQPDDRVKGQGEITEFGLKSVLRWLFPSFCASLMFLATTNQLCMNVAGVPFLWILPLAIYLISFILAFGGDRFYPRRAMLALSPFSLFILATLTTNGFSIPGVWSYDVSLRGMIFLYSVSLLNLCLVCHGELYLARPHPSRLTAFYLTISIGGALGGVFVSILAPLYFPIYTEMLVGVLLSYVFVFLSVVRHPPMAPAFAMRLPKFGFRIVALAGFLLLCGLMQQRYLATMQNVVYWKRNFYGMLRLRLAKQPDGSRGLLLMSGNIFHGFQFLDRERRFRPTLYYHENTGVGLAIRLLAARGGPLRVGIVGLGAGTLSSYARPGDTYHYYEIDPDVIDVATRRDRAAFGFVNAAGARGSPIRIVPGDARRMMEKDLAGGELREGTFDMLVLDAFSSDAIPLHLLTAEAFDLYRRLLHPDGVIAIHISNKYLDLAPIVFRLTKHVGCHPALITSEANPKIGDPFGSTWVIASSSLQFMNQEQIQRVASQATVKAAPLWTDNYSSLVPFLR